MKNLFVLLLFPLLTWSQSYVGHVGTIPIHFEIYADQDEDQPSKGRVDGYYFYNSKLINIPLRGVFNKEQFTIVDGYHYFEDTFEESDEVFRLKKVENQLVGSVTIKKKRYKVTLTETAEDPIEDFRNPKLTFIRDSISVYNDKQLVWLHEKYSNQKLFRLGNGFTSQQRAVFNPILDNLHLENAITGLDCNSWFEIGHTVNLVSAKYVSFTQHYSVYCGGAHPSHGAVSYNFDLNTLTNLDGIETLYPNLDFFKLLKEKYYDPEDEFQQECEVFTYEANWDYKQWNLTSEGVELTPSYPHAMTPCEESYFLSYEELLEKE